MELKLCSLSRKTSFVSMMILTTTFFLVEIVVGYVTNSMALVADSFHMLSDLVSLLVGFLALRYSKIGKRSGRYTFGWARAEVLGALVNSVFLVALCFSILVESFKRMVVPEPIQDARLVLIVGTVGLVVNVIGLFLFHQHGHSHSHGGHNHSHGRSKKKQKSKKGNEISKQENDAVYSLPSVPVTPVESEAHGFVDEESETVDTVGENMLMSAGAEEEGFNKLPLMDGSNDHSSIFDEFRTNDTVKGKASKSANQLNMRGVYLHVLGDAMGSVIVIISALIIMHQTGKWTYYVDPTMSVLMVLIILKTSIPLLKESALILMQTVPTHLKIQEIQDKLVDQIPQVQSVHEFHVWQLAGHRIIASAHVRCHTVADYMAIANKLKEFFHNEGIHSTTIQPEFEERIDEQFSESPTGCMLECGPDKNCQERTCCGPQKKPETLKRRNNAIDSKGDPVEKITVL